MLAVEARVRASSRLVLASLVLSSGLAAQSSSLFESSMPLLSIEGPPGAPPYLPVAHPTEGLLHGYAPRTDIANPALNPFCVAGALPHPNHVLTVFHPTTAKPEKGYPVVLHSTAAASMNPGGGITLGFLSEALRRGWAVITVGSTGLEACPTTEQVPRCFLGVCSPLGMACPKCVSC